MQSVSSRIWTRVAVSIFYDDKDYTTGTSTWLIELRKSNNNNCDHLDICKQMINMK